MHAGSLHVLNRFSFNFRPSLFSLLFFFDFFFHSLLLLCGFYAVIHLKQSYFFPLFCGPCIVVWSMKNEENCRKTNWLHFLSVISFFSFVTFFSRISLVRIHWISVTKVFQMLSLSCTLAFDHFLAETINNVFSKEKFIFRIFRIWDDRKFSHHSHYKDDTIFIECVDLFGWEDLNILSVCFM